MRKTRVILTVDTEPSVAGAMADRERHPPIFEEPVWGEVDGKSEALGFMTRTLQAFEIPATFFVETVHTGHFGTDPMGRRAQHLAQQGQDVQLHIHPVWRNFRPDAPPAPVDDNSAEMSVEALSALIDEGCDAIEQWTGRRPVAMRTGNFDAGLDVYRAMARSGLTLASNLCIANRDYAESQLQIAGGVRHIEGVTELAVNCFRDPGPLGRNRYRALQVTACSGAELAHLLRVAHAQSAGTVVIVTHPFEYLKRDDFRYSNLRPNRMVQQRLARLCHFLCENENSFEVTTFAELAATEALPEQDAPRLRGALGLSVTRAAQNFLNDRF